MARYGSKARLAVETAPSFGSCEWVNHGDVIRLGSGASAPGKENFCHFEFMVENVVDRARRLIR